MNSTGHRNVSLSLSAGVLNPSIRLWHDSVWSSALQLYLILWLGFCALAAGVAVKRRKNLLPEWRRYLRFLLIWWKVSVFVPAFVFVTFAGSYTDDETWDVISGGGMSVLTFLTASWSLGTIYKVFRRQRPLSYLIVALALWLFSSSWFYDGYLLLRDGAYTQRWLGNLVLSPIIYLCAGLFWSLEPKTSCAAHPSQDRELVGRPEVQLLQPQSRFTSKR